MSVRSNSIVTLDTRIQGGEIAHSTAILKCFCNAVTIQSFFFLNSFTMMCMALYAVVLLQEFEIWSLAYNFISFIVRFHRLFATNLNTL